MHIICDSYDEIYFKYIKFDVPGLRIETLKYCLQ